MNLDMDSLFWFHLVFVIVIVSIPFWSLSWLRYGIYIPLLLSTGWIIFDGCPLTRFDRALNDELFSQVLLKPFFPNIDKLQTTRVTHFILLVATFIGFMRLCRK